MRMIPLFSLIAMVATPLWAQDTPQGCFSRDYSDAHLRQNPEQVVDKMTILFETQDGFTSADVRVLLADQGHAKRAGLGGQRASETGGNFAGDLRFGVECDGGWFDVIATDGDTLLIATEGFRLAVDGCVDEGPRSTLGEAGSDVTRYRLKRDDLAACDW